jgi:NDP-sugar pyrophosphorylase family protein
VKAWLVPAGSPSALFPLTCTRPLAACPVANRPLATAQRERLAEAGLEDPGNRDPDGAELGLWQSGAAWVSVTCLRQLAAGTVPALVAGPAGTPLAWTGRQAAPPAAATVLAADRESFALCYPWDLLRLNEMLVGALSEDRVEGVVRPGVVLDGHLTLGPGSILLPGVYLEGNAVIGCDCKIGPNCYLRGQTAIGDGCHVGNAVEIKNSILLPGAAIGHLSYCGDSIVGAQTNFGAGTITANFRHDGRPHRSMVDGVLVDTGRRKFGAILGDDVHTGIHTAIYPGRKIWPHLSTLPGEVVSRDLMPG